MKRVRKTTLVFCLGAIAFSLLLTPASAEESNSTEEITAAEAGIAADETPAVVATSAVQGIGAAEAELAAEVWNLPLTCSKSADLDGLVISEAIRNAIAGLIPAIRIFLPSDETIIGAASFYDEPQETASGERFDPDGFTAAAQLEIRAKFGGIKFGVKYQPAYAVVEYAGKKLILRFNDVGPLRPGRKFDLSRAAMAYFDGLIKGVLPDVKVTPLPLGQSFPAGPVTDTQLAALGIAIGEPYATAQVAIAHEPVAGAPDASVALPADAAHISARLYPTVSTLGES